jgi:hypothetical protein
VGVRDDEATRAALASLESCSVETREATKNVVNNNETGQPFIRGELLVAFGGDFFQKIVSYAETNHIAPVHSVYDQTNKLWQFRLTSNDQLIAELPSSQVDGNHDLIVIETVRDPVTGIPMLLGYGIGVSGTAAAAWYFTNVMMPSLTSYTNSWYVFEWVNADDAGPTSVGEFSMKTSG